MNNPRKPRTAIKVSVQGGFTLLELVLVVFIMGTLATISMSFIESEDSQWRYDESLRKMAMVRDAVLKVRDYKSQQIMSGFVFDNGMLPTALGPFQQLINGETLQANDSTLQLQVFEEKEPYFFYDDGNSSVKLSDLDSELDSELDGELYTELTLFKGYRAGAYISSGLDSSDKFLDAWGTEFSVLAPSPNYSVNLAQHTAPYDNQPGINMTKHDWGVPANQLRVTLINSTVDNFPSIESESESNPDFTLVLFVYENDVTAGKNEWINYRLALNSESVDNIIQISAGESLQLRLIQKLKDVSSEAVSNTDLIPAGNHLLVLIDNSKFTSTPTATAGNIPYNGSSGLVFQKFTLFPGSSLPNLTLTIK
jgi:prepilin-type N-terminal cleavage/methylation domain-containing protein